MLLDEVNSLVSLSYLIFHPFFPFTPLHPLPRTPPQTHYPSLPPVPLCIPSTVFCLPTRSHNQKSDKHGFDFKLSFTQKKSLTGRKENSVKPRGKASKEVSLNSFLSLNLNFLFPNSQLTNHKSFLVS